jgi:hypothetical protein
MKASSIGLLLGLALAVLAPSLAAASDPPATEPPTVVEAAPDVMAALPVDAGGGELSALLERLGEIRGVAWVGTDQVSLAQPVVLVGFDEGSGDGPLGSVETVLRERFEEIELGGRAVDDGELLGRIRRGVTIGLVLAALALGAVVALRNGRLRALLSGGVVLSAGWLAAVLGQGTAGSFDGSLATTPVPGALAGALVAGYVVLRSLHWFESPVGDDQAEMARRAVAGVGLELFLTAVAVLAAAVVLEPLGPGRSLVLVLLVAGLSAGLLSLAIVPLALAALAGSTGRQPGTADDREPAVPLPAFLASAPNGRSLSIGLLAAVAGVLLLLSLGSFRSTGGVPLLEGGSEQGAALEQLESAVGDPTDAVVAHFEPGTARTEKVAWLERVSALSGVARVDSPIGRYQGGSQILDDGSAVGIPALAVADGEAPTYALVVPTATGRSEAARQLPEAVAGSAGSVDAELSGEPVDAVAAAGRDRSVVWFTILVLAAVGGAASWVLVGDAVVTALVIGLRLLESMALVGLYQLVISDPTGAEILTVLILASFGAGLFELGFLRRLLHGHRIRNTEELLAEAMASDGYAVVLAVTLTSVTALGLAASGIGVVGRFGALAAVALVIEAAASMWLLRPALLGDRVVAHFASQPVGNALRVLAGEETGPERVRWEQVVEELLASEFAFQTDPEGARLDEVFVPETALFRDSTDHLRKLAAAGLRISGRAPMLRSLKLVGEGSPAALAATVDHPTRQLVDQQGAVVGVRRPERRSVMLWVTAMADGGHRIVDAVELGTEPVQAEPEPLPGPAGVAALPLE